MDKKVNTLHFTLGENSGKLLTDIAREHLLYGRDPEKAVKTLMTSLVGLPRELALKILVGKEILTVDSDRVTIICSQYLPDVHKDTFPPLDIEDWSERKLLDMKSIAQGWDKAIVELRKAIINNRGEFDFSVKYERLIKFFYDGDSENLIEIDNDTMSNVKCCVLGVKNFVEECMKTLTTIKWLYKNYPDYIPESFVTLPSEVRKVNTKLFQLMIGDDEVNQYIRRGTIQMSMVNNYIEKQLEIDKIVSTGIKPVEITDGYNAGWLSPEGVYYGLNGEISNMLHMQIADALAVAGIIPAGERDGDFMIDHHKNPDTYLEQTGWVKIHGDWILYDGWNLDNLHKDNIAMTEKQKEAIYKYGQVCCDGILKLGYSQQRISAARFNMTDLLMLRKYFEL